MPNNNQGEPTGIFHHWIQEPFNWFMGQDERFRPVAPDINSPMYQYGGGKGIDEWIQSQLAALQQGAGRDFSQATDAIAGNALMHGTYDSSVPGGQAGQAQSAIQANLANAMASVMGQGQDLKLKAWQGGMDRYNQQYGQYLQNLNEYGQSSLGAGFGIDINALISMLINSGSQAAGSAAMAAI